MSSTCARCHAQLPSDGGVCPRCLLTSDAPLFAGLELHEELGTGGMGTVFRARHLQLQRDVAVKVLKPELAADPELRERFEREARALARVDHPHVTRVLDAGEEDGAPYLVMELISGGTLASKIPASEADVLRWGTELCSALEAVHAAGIIHRDVKPQNVLLTPDGVAKLADFGIARVTGDAGSTRTGTAVGTPGYLAPEVLAGQPVDARADLYAVGALLKHLRTGQLPVGETAPLAGPLDAIVKKSMAHNPDARFQTAASLGAALGALSASTSLELGAEESLWLRAVALVQVAALACVMWAGLMCLTPKVLPPQELPPLVSLGARTLDDGRIFTLARFETGWVLAALIAVGLALGATGLLHRHWRVERLTLSAPDAPLPTARWTFGLGLAALASYLLRNVLAGNGVAPSGYVPVGGGLLLLAVAYFGAITVLEARRRGRPLLREPGLFLGGLAALVPPVADGLRQLSERLPK